MSIEVGQVLPGKITGITNFGAFVDLGNNKSGFVHISEISEGFVKDINDFFAMGDEVQVKVLKLTPDGKINLSIRQAQAKTEKAKEPRREKSFEAKVAKERSTRDTFASKNRKESDNSDFDSMMNQFLKDSEDRLVSLKRNTEGKRGGRGGRRG